MAEPGTLTLAFVSSHPGEAARVLAGLPVDDAAALFASLPARSVAPALEIMSPPTAARVLLALDDQHALGLLAAVGVQNAVAMLRHVKEPRRTLWVEGLSTATALASRLLLGYPEDTVGAWTDPEVVTLGPDILAGAALERVCSEVESEASEIQIVSASQKLQGVVELQVLLRAPATTSLAALMRPPAATLPAAMPLSGAANHPGWKRSHLLPVVEQGQRFIGMLHADRLAEAQMRHRDQLADAPDLSLPGLLARSYWDTVSELLSVGLAALPDAPAILPEDQ